MPRQLRVFLCHASQDKPTVRKLYAYLKQHGIQPWLDQVNLLPGQNWEVEIPKAIDTADVILVCLSKNSINKEGYVQKEITFALDKALEKPEGIIFLIPVKLEECDVPKRLSLYQWVSYFNSDGRRRLVLSLYVRAEGLGEEISSVILDVTQKTRPNSRHVTSDAVRIKNKRKSIEKVEGNEEDGKLGFEPFKKNSRDFRISGSEVNDKSKLKGFQIIPPFFSSWKDMFIWLATPLILIILTVTLLGMVTAGYEFIHVDKQGTQLLIVIVYLLLVGSYTWLSFYNVREDERLVVFFAGSPIGERGPGPILLLPFLYFGINKVDLREKSKYIKNEKCVTRDFIVINAGLYITWQINDPILSLTKISELEDSMLVLSTAILRTSIAEFTIQETRKKSQEIKTLIRTRIENIAGNWGVQINNLELNL